MLFGLRGQVRVFSLVFLVLSSILGLNIAGVAQGATESYPIPSYSSEPLELELIKNPSLAQERGDVITADTLSELTLTRPSLWWVRDQLPRKLVLNWLAYPKRRYVDVVVNPQFWNILEPGDRYALINKYGVTAQRYGYNVRIFNLRYSDRQPIVAYTCVTVDAKQYCYIQWQDNSHNLSDVNNSD
jgi:hypothetical protein